MFYRILDVTKIIPIYYSQGRHNDVINGKTVVFFNKSL